MLYLRKKVGSSRHGQSVCLNLILSPLLLSSSCITHQSSVVYQCNIFVIFMLTAVLLSCYFIFLNSSELQVSICTCFLELCTVGTQ